MKWIVAVCLATMAALGMAFAPGAVAKGQGQVRLGPIEGHRHRGLGASESTNWSGYAAYGSTFTSVQGEWVQPTATCGAAHGSKVKLAAFWVGLDGYEDNTVEQTGTEADCEGATPLYYAWWELYPKSSVLIEEPVKPGDRMRAEVSQGQLVLEDVTKGWQFSERFLPEALAFSSAEWIAEAPAKNALTSFGSVHFSSASAGSDALAEGAIESEAWSDDAITLVTGSPAHPTVLASPGGLEEAGHAFTIDETEPGLTQGHGHDHPHR